MGTHTGTERPPDRRPWFKQLSLVAVVLAYVVPLVVAYDRLDPRAATISGTAHSVPSFQFCEQLGIAGARIYFSQALRIEFVNVLRTLARPRSPKDRRLPDETWDRFPLARWADEELDFATTDREFEGIQPLQLWLARDDRPALV